jgi:NTP pyrophosphatase (non-canonical NTP hydrolase)
MADLKDNPTLADLQKHIREMCKEKGWDTNSITEIYLLFSEEAGELAKAIRKTTGFKGESDENAMKNLREEFADVLNYLMDLANYFDIDLEEVYREKHRINKERVWK